MDLNVLLIMFLLADVVYPESPEIIYMSQDSATCDLRLVAKYSGETALCSPRRRNVERGCRGGGWVCGISHFYAFIIQYVTYWYPFFLEL